MKALPILAAATVLTAAIPARAQSSDSYSAGYNDGYNDAYPATGMPSPHSDYGRGFQQGQDDADDDDEMEQRALGRQEQMQMRNMSGDSREPLDQDPGDQSEDK